MLFKLFNKFKWDRMEFTINFHYTLNVLEQTKNPYNLFSGHKLYYKPNNWLDLKLPSCEPDCFINDIPVWIPAVTNREFLQMGKIAPNIEDFGMISPFTMILSNDGNGVVGYNIIIPEEFEKPELCEFAIQRELYHIENNHFYEANTNKLAYDEKFDMDFEADKYALEMTGWFSKDIIVEYHKTMVSSTINAIPFLKKRYGSKYIHYFQNDSVLQKKLELLG